MISGNQAWNNALAQKAKQPLYTFEVHDFGIVLASFVASALATGASASITIGGYGVILYGIGGYGT